MLANRVRMGSGGMKSKELIIYDYGVEYERLNFYTATQYMFIQRNANHIYFLNELSRGAIYTGLIDVEPYNELHVNIDGDIYICDISQARGNYRIIIYSHHGSSESFIGLGTNIPNFDTTPPSISTEAHWALYQPHELYQILLT